MGEKETKTKKVIPWNSVQAEYILGVQPKDLALKYNLTSKQIRAKASREKWKSKKGTIKGKIEEKLSDIIVENEIKRNEQILEINDLAIAAYKEYFTNKDFKRCLVETTEPYKNEKGEIVFDQKGKPIMVKIVKIADVPFVVAPMLRHATEGLARANDTSRRNEGLDKEGGGDGTPPTQIIHLDNLDDSRI